MGEDGVHDLFGYPPRAQDLRALERMLGRGGVYLVVEVVEHPGDAPGRRIRAVTAGIGPHGRFHRERVLAQAVGVGEFGEDTPGGGAIDHLGTGEGEAVLHQARAVGWRAFHLSMDFLDRSHWPL